MFYRFPSFTVTWASRPCCATRPDNAPIVANVLSFSLIPPFIRSASADALSSHAPPLNVEVPHEIDAGVRALELAEDFPHLGQKRPVRGLPQWSQRPESRLQRARDFSVASLRMAAACSLAWSMMRAALAREDLRMKMASVVSQA